MNQESASRVYLRITNANGVFFYVMHQSTQKVEYPPWRCIINLKISRPQQVVKLLP